MKTIIFLILFLIPLLLTDCRIYKTIPHEPILVIMPTSGLILMTYDGFQSHNDRWGNKYWLPSRMTRIEKDSVNDFVRAYFNLWDVKVTESEELFCMYPQNKRVRCVVTLSAMSDVGQIGKGYVDALQDGDTTSVIVNPSIVLFDANYVATAVAHEVGHQLGLQHHLKIKDDYNLLYIDTGNSLESPIMGYAPASKNRVWKMGMIWENGIAFQDDTAIISQTWRRIK